MGVSSLSEVEVARYQSTVKAVVNRLLLSRRIRHLPVDRDDLYQVGWVAVMNCLKTFDDSRKVKFETYATRAIKNAVNNELRRLSLIRIERGDVDVPGLFEPDHYEYYMNQIVDLIESDKFTSRERKIFWMKFLDELSFDHIGQEIGLSREMVRRIYRASFTKVKELVVDEF